MALPLNGATPEGPLRAPWAQPGITNVPAGERLLAVLRDPATLASFATDGTGQPPPSASHVFRGHGASAASAALTATPCDREIVAYHRSLGLGPGREYFPSAPAPGVVLHRSALEDDRLIEQLREDPDLCQIFFAYRDRDGERFAARADLTPVLSTPSAEVYEAANDKLAFARAGERHGFETPPMLLVEDEASLEAGFARLSGCYDGGCMVRVRRGSAGHGVFHALDRAAAKRHWRRLRDEGEVILVARVPDHRVIRQVATHGLVTQAGFAPILFSEQLLHDTRFRGARVRTAWDPDEIRVVQAAMAAVSGWLREVGYRDAPAGFDGLLIREGGDLRFLLIDPNVRMTATIPPWTSVACLSEAAGRGFSWQFQKTSLLSRHPTLAWLRRRLGSDLVDPAALERGGILVGSISVWRRLGPLSGSTLGLTLLGRDDAHLSHLVRRVRRLSPIVR